MKQIYLLSREHLDKYWDQISPLLESGLFYSEGELDISQLRLLIVQGKVFVVVASQDFKIVGALAFELVWFPNYRAANIISYGGDSLFADDNDMKQFKELLQKAGIKKLQGWCKPAQARLFKSQFGFETPYQLVRLDIGT